MANIAAVHDLSGVGRCSLTAAISVLSAMGHHCCPVPTAVLSNQTGFPWYSYLDFTDEIPQYLEGWKQLRLPVDIIFTGFLGGAKQPGQLLELISEHPDAVVVVDPVMGDEGELYACYGLDFVAEMHRLVQSAHVILPNLTEFLLLAGLPADHPADFSRDDWLNTAAKIGGDRLRTAVVTGICDGSQVCNAVIDLQAQEVTYVTSPHSGVSYSGTGDVFASVICGCIANGIPVTPAVQAAVDFLSEVIRKMPPEADPRYGIYYERDLWRLSPENHIRQEMTQPCCKANKSN